MADVKISGLPASTTPLAGTEVLPIVQGGQTRQVSVANLTAGRAVSATTVSATTSVTTPIVQSSTSAGTTLKNASGTTCIQYGAGGGTNVTIEAAINMNGANAHIEMSPTGTGHVTINPTAVGDMDNMVIGATVPKAGSFTTATANSYNKMAITAPATSSTLAVADGKTLTANKTLTLDGTDSTTQTFPTTSATIARTDAAQTFTGLQTFSSGGIKTGASNSTGIYTATGNTGSIASGVATTIFTAASGLAVRYDIATCLNSTGAPAVYTAIATVVFDGSDARIIATNGTLMTLTLSGNAVQVTQTSGGAATVYYNYLRIG